jgi:hypothetical protein
MNNYKAFEQLLNKAEKIDVSSNEFMKINKIFGGKEGIVDIDIKLKENFFNLKNKIYMRFDKGLNLKLELFNIGLLGAMFEGDVYSDKIMTTLIFTIKDKLTTFPIKISKTNPIKTETNELIEKYILTSLRGDFPLEEFKTRKNCKLWELEKGDVQTNFDRFIACLIIDFIILYNKIKEKK